MNLRCMSLSAVALLSSLVFPARPGLGQSPVHPGKEVAWAIGYDPKSFDPAKVDDGESELVRYLTGGVLLRLNRSTLALEPALAETWSISPDGRLVTFHLRRGLRFSDGSPLTSADAAASIRRVLALGAQAPAADGFLDPAKVTVDTPDPLTLRVHLPQRIVSIGNTFDEIAIEPANHPSEARVTAGPFTLAEYKRGESLRLSRNPYYWQHDPQGAALPYLESIRLDIVGNREMEEVRFVRGDYSVLDNVPPDAFDAINRRLPGSTHDQGPSLNTEQMWFNESAAAPLPAFEKAWFTNTSFRQAISLAIQRQDLARLAYNGHATPANGFISPANKLWYNQALPGATTDIPRAHQLLQQAGFRLQAGKLVDKEGHPVSFSLLTNTGNRARARMASLIQQDLASLGITVNVVTLDFPALIERLMHTQNYEAALLGLSDVQPDPSSMMNLWLSSSPNHQWNPAEKSPATAWEAEIDRQMHIQAEAGDQKTRKAAIDRVQAIVVEQQPFIYLVYPNVLSAVSPSLAGVRLAPLQPAVVSDIQWIHPKEGSR